jgi:hypothetical protein
LLATQAAVFSATTFVPQGGESAISGELPGDQTSSHLAISPDGGWVVWQDAFIDGQGLGIGARKLDANLAPSGAAFRVNKTTKGDQEKPRVSLLNGGGAVVVWQGGNFGFQNIYARFFDANGSALNKSDILVNRPDGKSSDRITTNLVMIRNNKPRVKLQRLKQTWQSKLERTGGAVAATLSDGSVIVAYTSSRKVSWTTQVVTERVRKVGRRWLTNSVLTSVPGSSDSMQDIYFQRFTATGEKIGEEIRANQFLPFNQHSPAIAARADGTFVLAWTSDQQRTGAAGDSALGQMNLSGEIQGPGLRAQSDIVARLYSNDGTPVAGEFVVNTDDILCSSPSVAASSGGGFTIAWMQKASARDRSLDIFARAYSPSGNPVTEGFLVNENTYGDQHTPRIAAAPGGQLVVWTSLKQDGSFEGVYGRWLNDGDITSSEFRVNTTTYLKQFQPSVAADAANRVMVIWSTYQTEAGFDLFGQRYTAQ